MLQGRSSLPSSGSGHRLPCPGLWRGFQPTRGAAAAVGWSWAACREVATGKGQGIPPHSRRGVPAPLAVVRVDACGAEGAQIRPVGLGIAYPAHPRDWLCRERECPGLLTPLGLPLQPQLLPRRHQRALRTRGLQEGRLWGLLSSSGGGKGEENRRSNSLQLFPSSNLASLPLAPSPSLSPFPSLPLSNSCH